MINRRKFFGILPVGALAISAGGMHSRESWANGWNASSRVDAIASPPVVQNPRATGFGVSIAVAGLCTAWVEYGFDKNDLQFTSIPSHHGLIVADDQAIHIRVNHPELLPAERPIFYRVMVQPLSYKNAYQLERGEPQATGTYELRLPSATAKQIRVVSINDTHENNATIAVLHQRIENLNPDLLIWNGDTCNDFDAADTPNQIMLNPAKDLSLGWASTRPLLFSNGNHDVRGERAREVVKCFASCPESSELPYNQALRYGPLAIVTLDTGEDKPDRHPVFAGTAAYEPYRELQAQWLKQTVLQPSIRDAPFKIVTSHIPLRGIAGQQDGTTLDGYAQHSGFGAKLWLPTLIESGFQAILSGHTHRHRLDAPTETTPISQFVGGGPKPEQATLTIIEATENGENVTLEIKVVDLDGKLLLQQQW